MTRKEFMHKSTKAAFAFGFIAPLNRIFGQTISEKLLPEWAELVEYARWCPTVHNLQAHKLKIISASEAHLYYEPSRLLPVGDPDSIFSTVALGIFVEHLSISAAQQGAQVTIEKVHGVVSNKKTEKTHFLSLKLSARNENEPLSRDLFRKRKTARLAYDGRPLNPSTLEKLAAETAKFNHVFHASSDKTLIDCLIDLNQKTLFEDLESKENREELDHLFRYSKAEAKAKKDGLSAKCMGFSGKLMQSVFQKHKKWTKGLRKKLLAKHYKASFKGSETLCWIGGAFQNTEDWLRAGKMLARTWLVLTKEGANLQPFGSLITNPNAYSEIKKTLKTNPNTPEVWMVFRAGYCDEPAQSYRLDTNQIIF